MIRVRVIRGPGLRPGQDIVEPLLSGSEAAARERGRIELDANGSPRERMSLEIDPQPGLAPGQLVEVVEMGQSGPPVWRGVIDTISMEISAAPDDAGRLNISRMMRLEIEREEI